MGLWESYKHSIFLCHQRLADDVDFAIISAQNPAGYVEHPHRNLRLDNELEACIHRKKLPYRSVIGSSPDFAFQEKSWVVLCEKAQAIELAHQFQQNAIFWVECGALYLVPVLLPYQEEYLGAFQARLKLLPD